MTLLILVLFAFLLNLPFGAYRIKTRKFSIRWLLAIHLPVPLIFLLRVESGYGYSIIPLMILASVAGQVIGGKLMNYI